jgi:hypothetical protein
VPNGSKLSGLFQQAAKEFRADRPAAIVPVLMKANTLLAAMGNDPLIEAKRRELVAVIQACTGLYLEAAATSPWGSPGGKVRVATSALTRGDVPIRLEGIEIGSGPTPTASPVAARPLANNVPAIDTTAIDLATSLPLSTPYWLAKRPSRGSFDVDDPERIGQAENPPVLVARFRLTVSGSPLAITMPVVYRWVDPVLGERYRSYDIVPPATMEFERGTYLFTDDKPRDIRLGVRSTGSPVLGTVTLKLPAGWSAAPQSAAVQLGGGEADTTLTFAVTPGPAPTISDAAVSAEIASQTGRYSTGIVRLDYPHMPIRRCCRRRRHDWYAPICARKAARSPISWARATTCRMPSPRWAIASRCSATTTPPKRT